MDTNRRGHLGNNYRLLDWSCLAMNYHELKQQAFGSNQWSPTCKSDIDRLFVHCTRNFDKALRALKERKLKRAKIARLIEDRTFMGGLCRMCGHASHSPGCPVPEALRLVDEAFDADKNLITELETVESPNGKS